MSTKRWTFPVDGYVEYGVAVADGALFFAAEGGASEPEARNRASTR